MFLLSRFFYLRYSLTNYVKNSGRTLYTLKSLGVDSYIERRETVKQHFANGIDQFRGRMADVVADNETLTIFTKDLQNMVHLAESNDLDLQLLEGMMRKFHKQTKENSAGNFIFGPVVMRCLYHINRPDLALSWFKDPELDGFFDQMISYEILCDILYNHGRYQDVIGVYETIKSKEFFGTRDFRTVELIVFAACYKQNTPESFKYCSNMFVDLNSGGKFPLRRAVTLAAALAVKQNLPHVALEMVSSLRQQNFVTVRNIKVEAYANLGRVEDALAMFRALQQSHTKTRDTFTREAVNAVKSAVHKTDDKELIQNFNSIEKFLIENRHVTDKSLEEILLKDIETREKPSPGSFTNNNRNNRDQNYGFKKAQYGGRPGLTEVD